MDELSEDDCLRALGVDPSNCAALLKLGMLAFERGDLDQAESYYRGLSQQLPDRSGPLLMLGEVLQQQGRLTEAEAAYLKATRVDPGNPATWTVLGFFHLSDSDGLESAESCFRQAIGLEPDRFSHWRNLGQALLPRQPQAAVEALTRASQLEGTDAESHFFLGLAWRQLGAIEMALRHLEKAVQLDPERAGWWDQLGGLFLDELNDPGQACQAFELALGCADAEQTYALANLFWSCLAQGDLSRARRLRSDLDNLEPVGYALCDAALTVVSEGPEAARPQLSRLEGHPEVSGDYAVDWRRLQALMAQPHRSDPGF
ncbi:tetratricopeptide repeat protein [bacterium]|nr:tetratricopeptide repeat protein [bacterium]